MRSHSRATLAAFVTLTLVAACGEPTSPAARALRPAAAPRATITGAGVDLPNDFTALGFAGHQVWDGASKFVYTTTSGDAGVWDASTGITSVTLSGSAGYRVTALSPSGAAIAQGNAFWEPNGTMHVLSTPGGGYNQCWTTTLDVNGVPGGWCYGFTTGYRSYVEWTSGAYIPLVMTDPSTFLFIGDDTLQDATTGSTIYYDGSLNPHIWWGGWSYYGGRNEALTFTPTKLLPNDVIAGQSAGNAVYKEGLAAPVSVDDMTVVIGVDTTGNVLGATSHGAQIVERKQASGWLTAKLNGTPEQLGDTIIGGVDPTGHPRFWRLATAKATNLYPIAFVTWDTTGDVVAMTATHALVRQNSGSSYRWVDLTTLRNASITRVTRQANRTIAVDGAARTLSDGPYTIALDFGDGTPPHAIAAPGAFHVTHQYASTGTYTLTLSLQDMTGSATPATSDILVADPPHAVASATTAWIQRAVTFSSAGTTGDPNAGTLRYLWSFGDGATAYGATAHHTYTSLGDFTAILTVTDSLHNVGADTMNVHVYAPKPTASLAIGYTQYGANEFIVKVNGVRDSSGYVSSGGFSIVIDCGTGTFNAGGATVSSGGSLQANCTGPTPAVGATDSIRTVAVSIRPLGATFAEDTVRQQVHIHNQIPTFTASGISATPIGGGLYEVKYGVNIVDPEGSGDGPWTVKYDYTGDEKPDGQTTMNVNAGIITIDIPAPVQHFRVCDKYGRCTPWN